MSLEVMAAVLHHSRAKGTAKLVLLGIANHDGDGGAWVGVGKLATYANVDERNVQRALEKLVSIGELVVHTQQGGDHRTPDHRRPNRYDVTVTCPPWCDRTHQHRDTRKSKQPNLVAVVHTGGASVTRKRGGVAKTSPHPVAPAPPEPSLTTQPTSVGTQPQTARAVCMVCSHDHERCTSSQLRVAPADRHTFKARRRASR